MDNISIETIITAVSAAITFIIMVVIPFYVRIKSKSEAIGAVKQHVASHTDETATIESLRTAIKQLEKKVDELEKGSK